MTSKIERLIAEQKDLEQELVEAVDADVHRYTRTQAIYEDLNSGFNTGDYTTGDLDTLRMTCGLLNRHTATSATLITDIVDNLIATRKSIKELRRNTRVDPPRPIGGTGVTTRPGEDLDWGVKDKPTAADMDWIYEGGVLRSQRGLPAQGNFGDAYRASRAAGVVNPHFGVKGRVAQEVIVGGKWGQHGASELTFPGDAEASATFLGLTDMSSARVAWASHFGGAMPTGEVAVFDLGIQGRQDSHLMNARTPHRHAQIDGCWCVHYNPNFNYAAALDGYASFNHSVSLYFADVLVVRNHKWRGEQPTDPGMRYRDYSVMYAHGQSTSFLFEGNDCRGGGRGGMQNRPDALPYGEPATEPRPTARVMLRGNYYPADPGTNDIGSGGQSMGLWSALAGAYVYDNDMENFPFTALMCSGQASPSNYPTQTGNQIPFLHLSGNRFAPGPQTQRATLNLSSIDTLHIYGDNEISGRNTFDAFWNYERNGTMIGDIRIHANAVPNWMAGVDHYSPSQNKTVKYTAAELQAMLVPNPGNTP